MNASLFGGGQLSGKPNQSIDTWGSRLFGLEEIAILKQMITITKGAV
ncbi:hypothetical protein OAM01_02415 [bacterium]|nr:hypothetical protein [bacterium]